MVAWVPPPPGNRLFYSFVAPPKLELSAKPEVRWERGGLHPTAHPPVQLNLNPHCVIAPGDCLIGD